jgi:prepilin-type N-terminal cleavage/methylation domain-containing protein
MRSRYGGRGRMHGFTLIELLVVIAIIAILMAATLPMIPLANDQARISACEARLQQIGVAVRLYAEDYRAAPASLQALYEGRYIEQRGVLRCEKANAEYHYTPPAPTADRHAVIAGCVDPATPSGSRPHRGGSLLVILHHDGSAATLR